MSDNKYYLNTPTCQMEQACPVKSVQHVRGETALKALSRYQRKMDRYYGTATALLAVLEDAQMLHAQTTLSLLQARLVSEEPSVDNSLKKAFVYHKQLEAHLNSVTASLHNTLQSMDWDGTAPRKGWFSRFKEWAGHS